MNTPDSPLRSFLSMLRRRALVLVLVPAVTVGAAYLSVSQQDKVYLATMKIVAGQAGGQTQPVLGGGALTQTMTNLLQSNVVAQRTIDRADLDVDVEKFLKNLHVAVRPDSSVLDVSYESTSKDQAVDVLDTVADVFVSQVEEKLGVRSSISQLPRSSGPLFFASVFDPAHLEAEPIRPKPAKTIGFALALGLVLGVLIAFALENLDNMIRDSRRAESSFGAPVIGALPKRARRKGRDTTADLQLLRVNVEFHGGEADGGRVILVTSAGEAEGQAALVEGLATMLATAGRRVVALDADLLHPRLHEHTGVDGSRPGLGEVLAGEAELDDVLQPVELAVPGANGAGPHLDERASLRILPAGQRSFVPGLITADRVSALFDRLRDEAEYTIVAGPPLLLAGDALPLAADADQVVVAARKGHVTIQSAEAVRNALAGIGADRIGVVLTNA